MRNFAPFSEKDPAFAAARGEAQSGLIAARAFVMMLRAECDELVAAASVLKLTPVKGPEVRTFLPNLPV